MLIQLIHENTEEILLSTLEESNTRAAGRAVLLCQFSQTELRVAPDAVLASLKNILHDYEGEMYFCADGDLIIFWRGRIREIKKSILKALLARYPSQLENHDPQNLFQLFDSNVHGEDLRLMLREKLKKLHPQEKLADHSAPPAPPNEPAVSWKPRFSAEQQHTLRQAVSGRRFRRLPELLIVEDQDFSRRLLVSLFEKTYRCHSASDARQAALLYAEYAPDIVFLDIELPDADGHALAALFKQYDQHSSIVMVTGNNYARDVDMARANKVQGFIIKPYNKQKIMEVVYNYITKKKG